jgi:hypothetical protein
MVAMSAMRTWRRLLSVAVLLVPSLALAQLHPCDDAIPDATTATRGNAAGWCHTLQDDMGLPVSSVGFRLVVDTTAYDLGVLLPEGVPSASGQYFFEAPLPTGVGRGVHTTLVIAYLPEGSSEASNVALWQVGGPPTPPRRHRIAGWFRTVIMAPLARLR